MSDTIKPHTLTMWSYFKAILIDALREFHSDFLAEDLHYAETRFQNEGSAFLFIAIPTLGKAIDKALVTGERLIVPRGWRMSSKNCFPIFLNFLFSKVFEQDGYPRYGDGRACMLLRQVFLLTAKVRSDDKGKDSLVEEKVIKPFFLRTTREPDLDFSSPILLRARRLLYEYFSDTYAPFGISALHCFSKKPWGRHGPGGVADSSVGKAKWNFASWPGLPKNLWESGSFCLVSSHIERQPCSRVALVPKDFRGPRVICMEPKENQWAQQGLMDLLYRSIQHHPLTRRFISFENVEPSRSLCFDKTIATIDLKDASDLLSLKLVRFLFPKWIFALLTRYRTRYITWNGCTWKSRSFATMGSALCFPIETLVFFAIAKAAMGKTPHYGRFRVFGDDIIVPDESASAVCRGLSEAGLIVNYEKTCTTALVKESCGMWVYNGVDCTVISVKSPRINSHRAWLAHLDYLRLSDSRGLPNLTAAIRNETCRWLSPDSLKRRWNKSLQRVEVRVPALRAGKRENLVCGRRLLAFFVQADQQSSRNDRSERIKYVWDDERRLKLS